MQKDLKRLSIEAIMHKTMKDIEDNPDRALRNLVDMGANFANGRFQKPFFSTIQNMLSNEHSSYYKLLRCLLNNVSANHILDFGINVGYNSCTKGANTIRKLEKKYGFNIPWAIGLAITDNTEEQYINSLHSIIKQGQDIGIYTYVLYTKNIDPLTILPILLENKDCAFLLSLRNAVMTESLYNRLCNATNTLIAVYDDENTNKICKNLKTRHIPYAIFKRYMEDDVENIINGNWISSILDKEPLFSFLAPDHTVSNDVQNRVYNYIKTTRYAQVYPSILMDLHYDQLMIDRIISNDECILGFDENGSVITHKIRIQNNDAFNILHNDLLSILNHEENLIKK